MEYEGIGIGGNKIKKKDVLLFEMNGIDVENYSISEIRKLWCEPNIKLKFKNNKNLYCESADMLFIFAHDDKKKYMLEFELPYKKNRDGINRCEVIQQDEFETYIEIDKFNIYSYMNSNDIARHCQKIGHKFSSAECAYLANASENHTIAEKHAMFNHIIETMPDEQIKLHGSSKHYPEVSLHKTLKRYMEIENKALKSFYTADDNHIYNCDVYYCGTPSLFSCEYGLYKNLSDFWDELKKDNMGKFTKIRVTKINLSTQKKSTFTLNNEKEPVFLEYENLTDEEWDIVMMFDLMWFVCPTPFKKGDIVSFHPEALVEDTEEFVLESICYENMDERHFKMRREIGGSMDMTADGYFADTDGQLYGECIHDYLSLEYCDKKLTDVKRVLKPVSSYIKGEIPLHLAMNAYMSVIMQGKINHINRSYSEEYLISAGLKGEENED